MRRPRPCHVRCCCTNTPCGLYSPLPDAHLRHDLRGVSALHMALQHAGESCACQQALIVACWLVGKGIDVTQIHITVNVCCSSHDGRQMHRSARAEVGCGECTSIWGPRSWACTGCTLSEGVVHTVTHDRDKHRHGARRHVRRQRTADCQGRFGPCARLRRSTFVGGRRLLCSETNLANCQTNARRDASIHNTQLAHEARHERRRTGFAARR